MTRAYEAGYYPCSDCGSSQLKSKLSKAADGVALVCTDKVFCAHAKAHRAEALRQWRAANPGKD